MLQGPIGPKGDIGQQGIKGEDVAIGPKDDKGDIGIIQIPKSLLQMLEQIKMSY